MMSRPEPDRIYQSGRILRVGVPLLAALVAAATAAGIQATLPMRGPWLPVLATAGGIGVAALVLLWHRVTRRHLEVFDGWFRYVAPQRTLIAHWDDAVEVFSPTSRHRRLLGRHEYLVVLGGGTSVHLGSEIGADADLGDEIETRTRDVITARALSHISSGRAVSFGPITVTADAVEIKELWTTSVPYDRILRHRLQGRHYLMRSMDGHRTRAIRVSRIPSPAALFDVIEQKIASAREDRSTGHAAQNALPTGSA